MPSLAIAEAFIASVRPGSALGNAHGTQLWQLYALRPRERGPKKDSPKNHLHGQKNAFALT